MAHMRSCHFTKWYCRAKNHYTMVEFLCQEDLIEHMKTKHPGKFPESRVSAIARSCARARGPTFKACPFCGSTSDELEAHIGKHLRNLALYMLPWPQDDVDNARPNGKSSSASSVAVQTVKDIFEMPEPTFEDDAQQSVVGIGARLDEYGFIPDISLQHRDLELSEQSSDKILAHFAATQQGVRSGDNRGSTNTSHQYHPASISRTVLHQTPPTKTPPEPASSAPFPRLVRYPIGHRLHEHPARRSTLPARVESEQRHEQEKKREQTHEQDNEVSYSGLF